MSVLSEKAIRATIRQLQKQHPEENPERIAQRVQQVACRWRRGDGGARSFTAFCTSHWATATERDTLFARFEDRLQHVIGNLHHIYQRLNYALHVDTGPLLPVDLLFAGFDPFAHFTDDLFDSRLAFVILLNFDLPTFEEKLRQGSQWSRRRWAEVRLAEMVAERIPARAKQFRTQQYTRADAYISDYNIYMDRVVDASGTPLFPERLKLISHWGLRDHIKALYSEADALPRQRVIQKIMERVITQTIPRQVVNQRSYFWEPFSNTLRDDSGKTVSPDPEESERYWRLLEVFRGEQAIDRHAAVGRTLIERRFQMDREIPEAEVVAIIESILSAPVLRDIAHIIQQRLQRPLEPFDIWYTGLKARPPLPERELDARVKNWFPTLEAFQQQLPEVLMRLGFSEEKARYLAAHIQVEPARGAGHALGGEMKGDKAYLRTRVPRGGMDYKGFNTAMHELGHTVEQVFSLNDMDYYFLHGVPNTAFTEAFAFLFQHRDLDVLGIAEEDPTAEAWNVLQEMWSAFEIAGVSLLDIRIWHWLYEHPQATAEALRDAVLQLAQEIWNRYFAPVLGMRDQVLLAVYSHLIDAGMYTPDYTLGHVLAFQVRDYMRDKPFAEEVERMCRIGRLLPAMWMQEALGTPLSAQPLIRQAEKAIGVVQRSK